MCDLIAQLRLLFRATLCMLPCIASYPLLRQAALAELNGLLLPLVVPTDRSCQQIDHAKTSTISACLLKCCAPSLTTWNIYLGTMIQKDARTFGLAESLKTTYVVDDVCTTGSTCALRAGRVILWKLANAGTLWKLANAWTARMEAWLAAPSAVLLQSWCQGCQTVGKPNHGSALQMESIEVFVTLRIDRHSSKASVR